MIKLSSFPAIAKDGSRNIELFHDPDQLHHSHLDKLASPYLPEVREYLDCLKPDPRYIIGLINALGSYEYWSSNANGDAFEEEHLVHRGPIWGYETFVHYAYPYMHHRNKDPNRAFGSVDKSCWNPLMHRVELVVRIDRAKCEEFGAQSVVNKIDNGQLPNTSMGSKVPYDLSSITTDWNLYNRALATYDPHIHRHPGVAVLHFHNKVKKIPGLAITRDEYDAYCRTRMNEILPDGRKVCVFNPFPRFFDISFVFIGAEFTSKMMAKLAGRSYFYFKDAKDDAPHRQPNVDKIYSVDMEKVASIESARSMMLQMAEKKAAHTKDAAIVKDVKTNPLIAKMEPLTDRERDIPNDLMDECCHEGPLDNVLGSCAGLGIRIRPREFQRIILIRSGRGGLADELDAENKVFRPVDRCDRSLQFGAGNAIMDIMRALSGHIENRSFLPPVVGRRLIRISITPKVDQPDIVEENGPILDKIASLYNGYNLNLCAAIPSMMKLAEQDVTLREAIYQERVDDKIFEKTAATVSPLATLGVAVPAAYLVSHLAKMDEKRKMYTGKKVGLLQQLIANNPNLVAAIAGMGALKASGSKVPDKIIKGIGDAASNLLR